jgi:hypothetical protein
VDRRVLCSGEWTHLSRITADLRSIIMTAADSNVLCIAPSITLLTAKNAKNYM